MMLKTRNPVKTTKGITTSTMMTMEHFHDFYFLQAMEAAVKNEVAANSELEFSKSVEKFMDDLDRTMEKLMPNMALRVFMYLYGASLGEARHARDNTAKEFFLKDRMKGRAACFESAVNYPPNAHNLGTLVKVFSQEWRAGYGGKAWMGIAQALKEYQTTPPAAWLDHVVDLEHNNGTAFSKQESSYTMAFSVHYPSRFSAFLDYKFQEDILQTRPEFTNYLNVSPRIFALLTRYSKIFNKPEVKHIKPELQDLTDYSVEWGSENMELVEKWATWTCVGRFNRPSAEYILSESGLDSFYPSYFTYKQFVEKLARVGDNAVRKLNGKYPQVKKIILRKLEEYLNDHKHECKMDKAKVTYTVMPCTSNFKNNVLTLHFPLEYQEGYGEPEENGFCVNVVFFGNFKSSDECYISKTYGDLQLWSKSMHYWISNATLEALID